MEVEGMIPHHPCMLCFTSLVALFLLQSPIRLSVVHYLRLGKAGCCCSVQQQLWKGNLKVVVKCLRFSHHSDSAAEHFITKSDPLLLMHHQHSEKQVYCPVFRLLFLFLFYDSICCNCYIGDKHESTEQVQEMRFLLTAVRSSQCFY